MRDTPTQASPTRLDPADSPSAPTQDPDFLRHQQALASHLTIAPAAAVLRPKTPSGAATLSHW